MMEATDLGQRQTRQRTAILSCIAEAEGPLSVPEIYGRAREILPTLGMATVYRTLKLLQEARQIQLVILSGGETRYEKTGLGHHEHFQCRLCEQVFDLSVCPVHIPRGTVLAGGFIVEDHEMTLYGLCADCSAQDKQTPKSATKKPASRHAGHSC